MSSTEIDRSLVSRLIALQFPQWSDLPVEPVANDGHDNRTFHLGDKMSIRMPSAERYARHVPIEHEWLPGIAPHLPLPIPEPVGRGTPGPGYPWPWTVCRWIEGRSASVGPIRDLTEFAADLAGFLNALHRIDVTGAPPPGDVNFHRGGDLAVYDAQTRECIEKLGSLIDGRRATAGWDDALSSEAGDPPVWVHGDVAPGNLLVDGGRLSAVIDFGQLAAGDPSCDLAIAWTLFSGSSRAAFRKALRVDEATWIRGRGWALWKALLTLVQHQGTDHPDGRMARRTVRELLDLDGIAVRD